ncbi:hypothetical protein [Microbacterium sp. Marseille-Q6648]|uniref:hypothetical protein n=1 Tax=Microbacterium sp. Marseille-Q6648 TaxID=2937991 RepID=UPI00204203A3|nr:hypothetical protein [Microbacterium sp. Marseille-Q6648]
MPGAARAGRGDDRPGGPRRPVPMGARPDVVDTYVCPHRMPEFWAVGAFYEDFTQTEDAEVAALLDGDLGVDR